ncbi:Uncharacterized protein OBRU01_02120 [Operophtera brumata]|uniref:Uncharacterized protein n=1 Tax=Operophtera brumata TaxID=104452 RepID=A0A0L7LT01_OPEBR|nr:Uncharacterized protein OBRU01_02120 [Operophtera brumata]
MSKNLLDSEAILSINEEWMKLEEEWIPIDLETEEDFTPSNLQPMFSSLDLRKTTFDSSFLFKKVRRKVGRRLSKNSSKLDYKDFIQDLEKEAVPDVPVKDFYYINGQIISAVSVEEICDKIDDIFKSVEKLCSATSTIRHKKKINLPAIVNCSISTADLSFDDTEKERAAEDTEKEKSDGDDIDNFIDEAFHQLSVTMASLAILDEDADGDLTKESVTTLVKKFTSILKSPVVNRSSRRKRKCCERFKDLAEFWSNRAFVGDSMII